VTPATGASDPAILPGASSLILRRRGHGVMGASGLLVVPISFESKLGSFEVLYAAALLTCLFLGVAVGYGTLFHGLRKKSAEIANGYTSSIKSAMADVDLFWVHPITMQSDSTARRTPALRDREILRRHLVCSLLVAPSRHISAVCRASCLGLYEDSRTNGPPPFPRGDGLPELATTSNKAKREMPPQRRLMGGYGRLVTACALAAAALIPFVGLYFGIASCAVSARVFLSRQYGKAQRNRAALIFIPASVISAFWIWISFVGNVT